MKKILQFLTTRAKTIAVTITIMGVFSIAVIYTPTQTQPTLKSDSLHSTQDTLKIDTIKIR